MYLERAPSVAPIPSPFTLPPLSVSLDLEEASVPERRAGGWEWQRLSMLGMGQGLKEVGLEAVIGGQWGFEGGGEELTGQSLGVPP